MGMCNAHATIFRGCVRWLREVAALAGCVSWLREPRLREHGCVRGCVRGCVMGGLLEQPTDATPCWRCRGLPAWNSHTCKNDSVGWHLMQPQLQSPRIACSRSIGKLHFLFKTMPPEDCARVMPREGRRTAGSSGGTRSSSMFTCLNSVEFTIY
jgi:hypothetical protein